MAIAKDFATLMVKVGVKEKFKVTKLKMEKDLGVPITISNALEIMCDQILSDSIKLKFKIVPLNEEK